MVNEETRQGVIDLFDGRDSVVGLDNHRYLKCSFQIGGKPYHYAPESDFFTKTGKPTKMCSRHRGYRTKHYRTDGGQASSKSYRLKTYGLTSDQFEELKAQQNNVCAICGKPEMIIRPKTGKTVELAVDHDHASGQVRGLLCTRCNTAIGSLESLCVDMEWWAKMAMQYLDQFNLPSD